MAERSKALFLKRLTFLTPGLTPIKGRTQVWCFSFLIGAPGLIRVQFPAGNGYFSAVFSSHATYARGSLGGYWKTPGGWGVAESCGNMFKLRNKWKLCSKKVSKLNHSKFPCEKSKIFFGGFTHIKPMPPAPPVYPQMSKGIFEQGASEFLYH